MEKKNENQEAAAEKAKVEPVANEDGRPVMAQPPRVQSISTNLQFSVNMGSQNEVDPTPSIVIQQPPRGFPRTVWVTDFSLYGAQDFASQIYDLLREDAEQDITICIASYGGSIYGLFPMIGVMEVAGVDFRTVCFGAAMSAGAVLFSCGTKGKRLLIPNSTVMIHEVSTIAWGHLRDAKADLEEAERLNEILLSILAKNLGMDQATLANKMLLDPEGKRDFYFNELEAIDYHLADKIVTNLMEIAPIAETAEAPEKTEEVIS